MTLTDAIQRLREIESHRDDTYVEDFENVLISIAELNDPDSIVLLVEFLDDDAPFDELMFSIIHNIEIHDGTTYCRELLKIVPQMRFRSPHWASIVFLRILNSDSTRTELIHQIRNAPNEAKVAVRRLMEKISDRGPGFAEKTKSVIIATRS